MARASATFTATERDDFEALPRLMKADKFLTNVLQNLEYFAQTHSHSGADNTGGRFWYHDMKAIAYWGGAY